MTISNTQRFYRLPGLLLLAGLFLLTACSSSSSGGGGNEILLSGGSGGHEANGQGGQGGQLAVLQEAGESDIVISRSGRADASFSDVSLALHFGDNPLMVTSDLTVPVVDVAANKPAIGVPYLRDGMAEMRISDGDTGAFNVEELVTGLRVESGVTLTLELNQGAAASFEFDHDLENLGTITVEDDSLDDRGSLTMSIGAYLGRGMLDTSGVLDGQNAGNITVEARVIRNRGLIQARGADHPTNGAGNGGNIELAGFVDVRNRGDLDARGGESGSDAGGNGGNIALEAGFGPVFNSGDLNGSGGVGVQGGNAGGVAMATEIADVRNSGEIRFAGGAGEDTGGAGGFFEGVAAGGSIVNDARVILRGGDATVADGNGGNGGAAFFVAVTGFGFSGPIAAGDVMVSGRLDVAGGDSAEAGEGAGGNAGLIQVILDSDGAPMGQQVSLLGYRALQIQGGDAGEAGGNGGALFLQNVPTESIPANMDVASGGAVIEPDVLLHGGSIVAGGAGGQGGNGGVLFAELGSDDPNVGAARGTARFQVHRDIDLRSGESDGASAAAPAGVMEVEAYDGFEFGGAVLADGRPDRSEQATPGTGFGGIGGEIIALGAREASRLDGNGSVAGGDGESAGGDAGIFVLVGEEVTARRALDASGGSADPDLTGSAGGDGGLIEMIAVGNGPATHAGSRDISGGGGDTPGEDGTYSVGGECEGDDCFGII